MAVAEVPEPRAYLFVATRNLALDRLRRSRTEARADTPLTALPDPSPSPEDAATSRQRLKLLVAALNELPAATRAVFLMARVDGLPHREIAMRLGISVSMVEKHIMRAVGHTRERLSR